MIDPKPWFSYQDQLTRLQDRGMVINDEEKVLQTLERIGYYRLSGYWHSFRDTDEVGNLLDTFKTGASFQAAVALYVFDKKLRLLALDALERVEIALRVDISHFLGEQDTFAYNNPDLLARTFTNKRHPVTGSTRYEVWLNKHNNQIRRSKETFIKHYKKKYGNQLPIWVACEVWDFGTLSTLFNGMKPDDQLTIARKYGVNNSKTFASWLRSLNYLRNVCAHHSRLWNRNIIDQPSLKGLDTQWVKPFIGDNHAIARPFLLFCIIRQLLNVINPTSSWWSRLGEHLDSFPELGHLGLTLLGFGLPKNRRELFP